MQWIVESVSKEMTDFFESSVHKEGKFKMYLAECLYYSMSYLCSSNPGHF